MNISTKLIGLVATGLCLVGAVASSVSIVSIEKRGHEQIASTRDLLMKEKMAMLEHLVDSVSSAAADLESEDEQLKVVKRARYGSDRSGYFWINDTGEPFPRMVMHPILPELDGQTLDNPKFDCAMGKNQNLFQAFVEVCKTGGGRGFVPYLWPKPGQDKDTLHPKMSFVRKMDGKPWIIGTGVYVDDIDKAMAEIQETIDARIRSQIVVLGGTLVVLIGVSLVFCVVMVRRIIRPIHSISEDLRDLAVGTADLSRRISLNTARCSDIRKCHKKECEAYGRESHCWIEVGSLSEHPSCERLTKGSISTCRECKEVYQVCVHDEITALSSYFNAFLTRFQKIFSAVFQGIDTLNRSAGELKTYSEGMKDLSGRTVDKTVETVTEMEKVNRDTRSIEESMKNSASMIQRVAASSDAMTAIVKTIGSNSDRARVITGEAVERAESASDKILSLGAAARDIDTVTEAITEISEQTNLLALNATIEAARAGEAGKGFAVVANEIKELARQTTEATARIREKIEGIQQSTGSTVSEIEQVSRVIFQVNDLVASINVSLEEQLVSSMEITAGVNESARDIGDVHSHVLDITSTSAHVEQNIGDISGHAMAMGSDIERVHEKADELSALAGQLRVLVGSYKV